MNQSSQDYFKNEDDRNDFLISIPVIAIAGAFVLWQWSSKTDIEPIDTITLSTIEEASQISVSNTSISYATPLSDLLEEERLSERNKTIRTEYTPVIQNKVESDQELSTTIIVTTENDKSESDQIVKNPEITTPIVEEEDSESNSIEMESLATNNKAEEESAISNNASEDKIALDCSIAVGLYKVDANLNKMHNRLIDNGYNAIIVPLRNSSKVAIRIPCDKESSRRILQEIRSDFAHDAFIE